MNFCSKDECNEDTPRYECGCGTIIYFIEKSCPTCQSPLLILKGDIFCEFKEREDHKWIN